MIQPAYRDVAARALSLPPAERIRIAQAIKLKRDAEKKPERVTLDAHLRHVDPGPWLDWWHVGAMVEQAQAVLDGETERLLICAPPRTYKSRPIVQGAPACRFRNEPKAKAFTACASDDLVRYHSRHARTQAEAAGVELRQDSQAVELWETVQGGTYKAVTVQAGRLGFGWDLGIIDDPFKSREDALRVLIQKRVWAWYRDDYLSRAQARPEGGPPGQIVIHQRLARGDLAGKLLDWLGETSGEDWTALTLKGYQERTSVVLPECVRLVPDPRKPGVPLCDDPETMRQIDERRRTNPPLHRAVDQQDPAEDASGGVFCGSWFHRLPVWTPADPPRMFRGWDFSAGGIDATASTKGGVLPGVRFRWVDMTEDHPAPASIQRLVFDVAAADTREVEIVIPSEVAIGKLFSDQLVDLLRAADYTVHLTPQRGPKRSRALAHAAAAAAICTTCHHLIVPDDSLDLFRSQGVCKCAEPGGAGYGRVELAMEPEKAERFATVHHGFTGEEGGDDDVVDAAAITYNVATGRTPFAAPAFV